MMNLARFSVGMEGVGIAERAYQRALAYARDRVQGAAGRARARGRATDHRPSRRAPHADDDARATPKAARASRYVTAAALRRCAPPSGRGDAQAHQAFVDLMIPIVKGWWTEMGQEVASLGVQVHGGMGFIEETGAAQHLRDARITTIYEGTTGIQANDLIGRKTARDGGQAAQAIAAQIEATKSSSPSAAARPRARRAAPARSRQAFAWVVDFVVGQQAIPNAVFAGGVPYLMLAGNLWPAGSWRARCWSPSDSLRRAKRRRLHGDKITTARFYAEHILNKAARPSRQLVDGAAGVTGMALDAF